MKANKVKVFHSDNRTEEGLELWGKDNKQVISVSGEGKKTVNVQSYKDGRSVVKKKKTVIGIITFFLCLP